MSDARHTPMTGRSSADALTVVSPTQLLGGGVSGAVEREAGRSIARAGTTPCISSSVPASTAELAPNTIVQLASA